MSDGHRFVRTHADHPRKLYTVALDRIDLYVFDFDCTLTLPHSNGRIMLSDGPDALKKRMLPDGIETIRQLVREGKTVAIASHADRRHVDTHSPIVLGGIDMIRHLLDLVGVDERVVPNRLIVAYLDRNKNDHLSRLQRRTGIAPERTVLIDDDAHNRFRARQAKLAHTIAVDGRVGFRKTDLVPERLHQFWSGT